MRVLTAPQVTQDKHFMRKHFMRKHFMHKHFMHKHGPNAYYGQK